MNTETLTIVEEVKECPWSNTNEYSWYTKHPVIERVGFSYNSDSVFEGSYIKSYSEKYGEERGYIPNPVLEKINCVYQENNQMIFNQEKYLNLLCGIGIKPIESDEQLDEYVKLVEPYFFNKEKSPEEVAIYNLLTILIVDYENQHYPTPDIEPLDFLLHLMESSELSVDDLVSLIGNENLTKLILNGACEIDKPIAKILGERFGVNYKHFL